MHFFADMSSSNLVISLVRPPQFELFVLDRRLGGGRGWLWVERYFLPVIHFIFIKSGFPGPSSNKIYGKKTSIQRNLAIANIFCYPLSPSLYRGSTVHPKRKVEPFFCPGISQTEGNWTELYQNSVRFHISKWRESCANERGKRTSKFKENIAQFHPLQPLKSQNVGRSKTYAICSQWGTYRCLLRRKGRVSWTNFLA